jgi:hypothetical protein
MHITCLHLIICCRHHPSAGVQMGGSLEQQLERKLTFVQELKCLPVAVQTAAANEQHYEVGPASPAAHLQQ